MAKFKTHVFFGEITGIALAGTALSSGLIRDVRLLPVIFLAAVFGSFLPDLDSDTGTPVQIIFSFFALIAAAFIFYALYKNGEKSTKVIIGFPVAGYLFFYYVLGSIFKKYTKHRGIFHSFPAFFMVLFAGIFTASRYGMLPLHAVITGISAGAGYLCHLVLDEIYSTVYIDGNPFKKKKSRESTLKFFSSSRKATVTVYILTAFFFFLDIPVFQKLF